MRPDGNAYSARNHAGQAAAKSDRYFIAVLALDVTALDVPTSATASFMSLMTFGHITAYGLLVPIATTSA